MPDFDTLLIRSQEFADHLSSALETAEEYVSGDRAEAAGAAAELSFEHAHALRVLMEIGTPNSASVLLRTQYEALLRASWLLYGASELQLGRLAEPLSADTSATAKNARSAEEMLKELERKLEEVPALRGLVLPLRQIRDVSWAAMNSFVHGGLHPIDRTRRGFPVKLAADILMNSNGMLHMAARLMARLTASDELFAQVEVALRDFTDCLPVMTASPMLATAALPARS